MVNHGELVCLSKKYDREVIILINKDFVSYHRVLDFIKRYAPSNIKPVLTDNMKEDLENMLGVVGYCDSHTLHEVEIRELPPIKLELVNDNELFLL